MTLKIDNRYVAKLESFVTSLPDGAIQIKKSLDDEILKRVDEYKNSTMKTSPFGSGLDKIRSKLSKV